jgi:hypothetical protein
MTIEPQMTTPRGVTHYGPADRAPRFLSDVIIELGIASAEAVEAAVRTARDSGETVGRVLVRDGSLTEDQLARATAARYGLDYVDLGEFELDPPAANLLPPDAAKRYSSVPLGFAEDGSLLVAMADPSDSLALSDIAFMTKLEVRPAAAAATLVSELAQKLPMEVPPQHVSRPVLGSAPSSAPTVAPPPPAPAVALDGAPEAAPDPAAEPTVSPDDHRDARIAALEAELVELRATRDAERAERAAESGDLRRQLDERGAELDRSREELAATRAHSESRSTELADRERMLAEARELLARTRQEFEVERESHAATERELRSQLGDLRQAAERLSQQISAGAEELASFLRATDQPG